jgi:hypothetical protein
MPDRLTLNGLLEVVSKRPRDLIENVFFIMLRYTPLRALEMQARRRDRFARASFNLSH